MMSVLQKNLSQLEVETVETWRNANISRQNSNLETLTSYSVRPFVYMLLAKPSSSSNTCTCTSHVKVS